MTKKEFKAKVRNLMEAGVLNKMTLTSEPYKFIIDVMTTSNHNK